MAEDIAEASGSCQVKEEDSEVEINIKTLDSQLYSFRVKKNMRVSSFKEKVESTIGIPVGQQRLIFRGKVLKDDHLLSEYHVEDGHTLHLVERQPAQTQTSSGTNSSENNGNADNADTRGSNPAAGGPRGRIGQVSHSVVLGTFNIGGDQGEGVVPDLSRIIGAVLNSIGIGSQIATGGVNNMPVSQGTGGVSQGTAGIRVQTGNQTQSGQRFFNFPFQSPQLPLTGATMATTPQNMVIPDALTTLTEFINRMEMVLSVNGSQSSAAHGVPSAEDTASSSARRLPTLQALADVMHRARQLLTVNAGAALSNIAGRLEREGSSADPVVRTQVQAEAMQVGIAVQHLGALLLELGRTIMTLRMGQSPAESVVNSGPAIYISSSGPNPIMVQPFPSHLSSVFGASSTATPANTGILSPLGVGDVSRNINIHIHAGSSVSSALSSVGSRTSNAEAPSNPPQTAGHETGTAHELPVRNIVAALPARSPAEASGPVLSVLYPVHTRALPTNPNDGATQQASSQGSITAADVNREMYQLIRDSLQTSAAPDPSSTSNESIAVNRDMVAYSVNRDVGGSHISSSTMPNVSEYDARQIGSENMATNSDVVDTIPTRTTEDSARFSPAEALAGKVYPPSESGCIKHASVSTTGSSKGQELPETSGKSTPLGLGSGVLQLKPRKNRQPKPQGKHSVPDPPSSGTQIQQSIARGQQVLQSLMSRGAPNQSSIDPGQSSLRPPQIPDQVANSLPSGGQVGARAQWDAGSLMSGLLSSPAIGNILTGISEQTGMGSPVALRGMLEQVTQSPSMRNALNQFTQQVEGNMIPGLGPGQGGRVDLSRMFQQLMPVVSQALGGVLTGAPPTSEHFPPSEGHHHTDRDERTRVWNPEIDLRQAVQSIEHGDPPASVFRRIAETATHLHGEGSTTQSLLEEICNDSELQKEYMEMLQRDLTDHCQFKSKSNSTDGS